MFVAGISIYAALIFSLLSFLVAVPSAIKVFNWTATLYKGSITFEAPMLFCLGFVVLFTVGGMTGLFLATLGMDMHVHDTYFVIAHFHFIMVGGMVMAYMGGLHYWWPKMTGRMYSEWWSRTGGDHHFRRLLPDVPAAVCARLPTACRGAITRTRRSSRPGTCCPRRARRFSASAMCCRCSICPYSLRHGKIAGPNPWKATGLEWQTPSPPPRDNFDKTPIVVRDPYEYASGKAQNEP